MTRRALSAVFAGALLLTGCLKSTPWPPDASIRRDSSVRDAGVDAGRDAAPVDAYVLPDGSSDATGPAVVLQQGTSGYLLRGIVLTPTGVLNPGEVLIEGDSISCVSSDCTGSPGAANATWIDTRGTISPGLIDAHNHLAYNFLPEWVPSPPTFFQNRYEWANDPGYENHILPYAAHRSAGSHYCPAAKWGELRSMIHGTTTVQGQSFNQSCVDWGVRNADHHHNLSYDHMRTTIASVRDITDTDAADYVASFNAPTDPVTRFAVHMAEGYAGSNVDEEFDSFAGRDPRTNRHSGVSLLEGGQSILIHSIPLTEPQLQEALSTNSKIVWSPSSNMVLYNRTANIARILELGITVGIGPDWTPSGEDDMLGELRYAWAYGLQHQIALLTPQRLWQMATLEGADVVGLGQFVGRLAVGYRADVSVFGRLGPDPYAAVIESRAPDVRLVFIDGQAYFGDADLEGDTAVNAFCDTFAACGSPKFLCVQVSPGAPNRGDETLEDIRVQLYNILEGIGYPIAEQYGRGDELLPLVDCSN